MEAHLKALDDFKPHLLVASGINILGGSDPATIHKRLTEVLCSSS